MSSAPNFDRRTRIRRSALWAAYGDALGFITELADAKAVERRSGNSFVKTTVPWRRRVGGQFGPTIDLPAGCLSDDTQLRLATCRSIRGDGAFDVETFAKVELTVWPSYALGAGRGSRAAAAALRRRNVTWATNFFADKDANYLHAGGNGAAMRIQPHVWAAPADVDLARLSADVMANAVCTHGHARGILGALFHARCLIHALRGEGIPDPDAWHAIADGLRPIADIARDDEALGELWLGQWELHSGRHFSEAAKTAVSELHADIKRCASLDREGGRASYRRAVEALEAFRGDQRGSGTKTSLLAAFAAWTFVDRTNEGMLACANELGTDTDSIATMAGALLGAVATEDPDGYIADRDYVLREADRMWAIGEGRPVPAFPYPDVVSWYPPRSASDAVTSLQGEPHVTGLGRASADSEAHATSGKTPGVWQWLLLWFGQRVLAKRRPRPKALPSSQRVDPEQQYVTASLLDAPPAGERAGSRRRPAQPRLAPEAGPMPQPTDSQPSLHELTDRAIRSGFDPATVGEVLLELAERDDGIEASIAYAGIIAKARASRRDRDRNRDLD